MEAKLHCDICFFRYDKSVLLCPPTKGEAGHISFSADPGHRRRRRRWRDSLNSTISLESMGGVEFQQTCMDTSLEQAKELIKFW